MSDVTLPIQPNSLTGSVAELAHLSAACARDAVDGTDVTDKRDAPRRHLTPNVADALRMHDMIDQIIASDQRGARVTLAD